MDDQESVTITDHELIEIVHALENLSGVWRSQLKKGILKLDYAVKIGSKLNQLQQQHLFELMEDNPGARRYENKLLIAYSQDMPDWAVLFIFRIYVQAEKVKSSIVMLNDLMDEYEKLMVDDFEYNFLEGNFPKEENQLEEHLFTYEKQLTALKDKTLGREKSYNQSYGDSSTSSGKGYAHTAKEAHNLKQVVGVKEEATFEEVKRKYRHLLKVLHPDKGGSAYLFDLVRKAYDEAE